MILHQTIRSARAEKPTGLASRRIRQLVLAGLLTSAMSLPSLAAWGMDSPQGSNDPAPTKYHIALPPIPHRESMPWLLWNDKAPTLKTDILIAPSMTPSGILRERQDRTTPMASIIS